MLKCFQYKIGYKFLFFVCIGSLIGGLIGIILHLFEANSVSIEKKYCYFTFKNGETFECWASSNRYNLQALNNYYLQLESGSASLVGSEDFFGINACEKVDVLDTIMNSKYAKIKVYSKTIRRGSGGYR